MLSYLRETWKYIDIFLSFLNTQMEQVTGFFSMDIQHSLHSVCRWPGESRSWDFRRNVIGPTPSEYSQ